MEYWTTMRLEALEDLKKLLQLLGKRSCHPMNQDRGQVIWKVDIKNIAKAELVEYGGWMNN